MQPKIHMHDLIYHNACLNIFFDTTRYFARILFLERILVDN